MDELRRSSHDGNSWSHLVTIGGEVLLRPLGFKRRLVTLDGQVIDLLEGRGSGGPDLIFLHGLGDRNSTWHRVLWRLTRGPWGRILVPDLPGFGRSFLSPGQSMPDMDEGLELMRRLVAEICPEPPLLIGNSLGGWLAWRFMTRYPNDLLGLLLLAPAGFMSAPEAYELGQRFLQGQRNEMTDAIMGDARFDMRFFARRIIGHMLSSEVVAELCNQDFREMLCQDGELAPYAARVRCLWGELDSLMPRRSLEMLRQEIGENLVFEPVGHAPQQTRPGMVVRELKALVEQLSQSALGAPCA
ncbi:MAG: alpha/beta hydrolase [Myxococcota bacterium]|nr:alpha/beta hydrolase [Myxococcota bacterium]